ncbi:hypothetical protein DRO97_02520 [Archaeoglobales archaeon]|nr:MAG: hypothetical protein DRO97_02520 [Archaeoglobales archaeon]
MSLSYRVEQIITGLEELKKSIQNLTEAIQEANKCIDVEWFDKEIKKKMLEIRKEIKKYKEFERKRQRILNIMKSGIGRLRNEDEQVIKNMLVDGMLKGQIRAGDLHRLYQKLREKRRKELEELAKKDLKEIKKKAGKRVQQRVFPVEEV